MAALAFSWKTERVNWRDGHTTSVGSWVVEYLSVTYRIPSSWQENLTYKNHKSEKLHEKPEGGVLGRTLSIHTTMTDTLGRAHTLSFSVTKAERETWSNPSSTMSIRLTPGTGKTQFLVLRSDENFLEESFYKNDTVKYSENKHNDNKHTVFWGVPKHKTPQGVCIKL